MKPYRIQSPTYDQNGDKVTDLIYSDESVQGKTIKDKETKITLGKIIRNETKK